MATLNQTIQAELVKTIIDQADDDLPRLVYADFLEDYGEQERAEFIRIQIELARLAWDDACRPGLEQRERLLLERNAAAWAAELMLKPHQVEYRRGFAEFCCLTTANYLKRGRVLHRRTPLQHVALTRVGTRLSRLAEFPLVDFPLMAMLNALDLCNVGLVDGDAIVLATSSYLSRVRAIDLSCNCLHGDGVRAFFTYPDLASLYAVNLTCNLLTWSGAAAMASEPGFARVTEFCLNCNYIRDAGLIAIVGSPYFAVTKLYVNFNYISDEGILALAPFTQMRNVTVLGLGSNDIGSAGFRAIIASPHFGRLEYFDISWNAFGDDEAVLWASSASMPALRVMDVTGCLGLGPRGLAALVGWQPQTRIKHQTLPTIQTGDTCPPYAGGLRNMDWVVNQLRDKFTQAVSASGWPDVELLDSNAFRLAGLRAWMPALYRSIAQGCVE